MYRLITFDMYSALLDIEGSAVPQVEAVLNRPKNECLAFFKLWRMRQWDYVLLSSVMSSNFLTYNEITSKALVYTEKKMGISLGDFERQSLMKIWLNFKAWPDAKETVDLLKTKGYKVAMLSNGDEEMLRCLEASSGITFDYIFSADQAGHYKPHPEIYAIPIKKLGIAKTDFLHVAGSLFDMMGAKAAGYDCAWSNRFGEYTLDTRYQPDFEIQNLRQLPEYL